MSKRPASQLAKKKPALKRTKKADPLDRWALEPGFKMNLKRCDQSFNAYFTPSSSVTAQNLTSVAQGAGDNERVGQRVRWFNMTIRGTIQYFPTATSVQQPDLLRLLIIYDRQTNGAAPLWSDIIANISSGTHGPYDPPNWYQRGRYKILRDWMIATPAMSGTVAAGLLTSATLQLSPPQPTSCEFTLHFFKALKGKLDTIYSGTGATTANINGGAIFIIGQNLGAGTGWVYEGTSTLEYMDV